MIPGLDPVVSAVLEAVVREAPGAIVAIADAIRGGRDATSAISAAKAHLPPRWSPEAEDALRRARLLAAVPPPPPIVPPTNPPPNPFDGEDDGG